MNTSMDPRFQPFLHDAEKLSPCSCGCGFWIKPGFPKERLVRLTNGLPPPRWRLASVKNTWLAECANRATTEQVTTALLFRRSRP
jgi:hypothetical protein